MFHLTSMELETNSIESLIYHFVLYFLLKEIHVQLRIRKRDEKNPTIKSTIMSLTVGRENMDLFTREKKIEKKKVIII